MSNEHGHRPLDGYRVIDITANVAGPLASQVLADLGADVIKIEPVNGEAARRITATAPGAEHVTPYFSSNNRGKRSVRLAIGTEEGRAHLARLIAEADVVIQGMRPGTMERHRLGPDDVASLNPRCIYASLSAYGGGGGAQDRPGIDMMVQAEAGCLSAQPAGELPRLVPFQFVDSASGHVLAQAILGALIHRERFGVVNQVDVAMYDVACSLQANYLTLQMNLPKDQEVVHSGQRRAVAVEPSGVYAAADGAIVLAAYVPAHWQKLVEILDRPDLGEDPRFVDQASRSMHSRELKEALNQTLSKEPADHWVTRLTDAGLMAARINTWSDVVNSDLFAGRELGVDADQDGRDIRVLRTPARYSRFTAWSAQHVPSLGEHDDLLSSSSR